jgi:uncharacterized membrane protein YcaP (DUF421 family)
MEILDAISAALGIDDPVETLDALQMALRAFAVYFFSLLIVKSGKKRFMGQNSALDVVMVIILGSVLSRGINGTAPFVPTLAAGVALVLMHRFMSWIVFRSRRFARFIEGESVPLVRNGQIDWDQMRRHDITERDLHIALRTAINSDDIARAKYIYLEPSGKFSVVTAR